MTTRLLVVIDETEPQRAAYQSLVCAFFMTVECELLISPGESVGATGKVRHALGIYSNLPWYGMIPDDCEPVTSGWDVTLAKACRPGKIAFCNNGLKKPKWVTPVICGDLLRDVGFIAPPGVEHFGTDRFWKLLAKGTGRGVYREDVLIRLSDRAEGEPKISWDAPKRRQKARQHEDKAAYLAFRQSGQMDALIKRLRTC